MDAHRDDEYRIELFLFPDGTSVEMIVFDKEPEVAAGRTAARSAVARPCPAAEPSPCAAPGPHPRDGEAHLCPVCGSDLVYPVEWQRRDDAVWVLRLRCPNCETQRDVTLGREGVEQLNRKLYLGAQRVAREAEAVSRRNFEDEAEKFLEALAGDLILPIDF